MSIVEAPYRCDGCGGPLLHPGLCFRCKAGLPPRRIIRAEQEARRALTDMDGALRRNGVPADKRRKVLDTLARRYPHGTAARQKLGASEEMNNEMAKRDEADQAIAQRGFSREQIDVIKNSIMPKASDAELAVFLETCRQSNLNPLSSPREIWAVPFRSNMAPKDQPANWVTTFQPICSIDGYRKGAHRSRAETGYRGQVGPQWCGMDGQWRDVWLAPEAPAACRVGIILEALEEPMWTVVTWRQYGAAQTKNPLWRDLGPHMLAIAAERHALRRACPNLCGLRSADELDDPNIVDGTVVEDRPELPALGDGNPETPLPSESESLKPDIEQMVKEQTIRATIGGMVKGAGFTSVEGWQEWLFEHYGTRSLALLHEDPLNTIVKALEAMTALQEHDGASQESETPETEPQEAQPGVGAEEVDSLLLRETPEDRETRAEFLKELLAAQGANTPAERAAWLSNHHLRPSPVDRQTAETLLAAIDVARGALAQEREAK